MCFLLELRTQMGSCTQSVRVHLPFIVACVHSLPFEFLFMSSALTGLFPQFVQV